MPKKQIDGVMHYPSHQVKPAPYCLQPLEQTPKLADAEPTHFSSSVKNWGTAYMSAELYHTSKTKEKNVKTQDPLGAQRVNKMRTK